MNCIEINTEMLDDPEIDKLTTEQLGKLFKEALHGEINLCSKYMRDREVGFEVDRDDS